MTNRKWPSVGFEPYQQVAAKNKAEILQPTGQLLLQNRINAEFLQGNKQIYMWWDVYMSFEIRVN